MHILQLAVFYTIVIYIAPRGYAVSSRPVTTEAWPYSQANPCGICGGQSGTVAGFSTEYFGFPLSIISPTLHCQ